MTLRPYQTDCIKAIRDNYPRYTRQLLSLATGAGKGVLMAEIIKSSKGRALVIAHTDELIRQAVGKITAVNPGIDIGIEKGPLKAGDSKVVVASIQTLKSKRMRTFPPATFDIIIIDEAHHVTNKNQYGKLLDYFKSKLAMGFTATPFRTDRQSLAGPDKPFQAITYDKGIRDLVVDGYLVPIKGYQVRTSVDLTNVKSSMGDFEKALLQKSVNVVDRNRVIIEAYEKYAPGEKTIIFCAGVEHAKELAGEFYWETSCDEPFAQAIYGDLDPITRAKHINDFRNGKIRILTNYSVLTEGFDVPDVSCIIMARPTKSPVLYVQSIGRGTRIAEGKTHLKVVDIVDNTKKFNIMTIAKVFNQASPHFDCQGRDVIKTVESFEELVDPIDPGTPVTFGDYKLLMDATIIDLLGMGSEFELYDYKYDFPDAPATPKQLDQIRLFRMPTHDKQITRAQASFLIDREFEARKKDNSEKLKSKATPGQLYYLNTWKIAYETGVTFGKASQLIIGHKKSGVA